MDSLAKTFRTIADKLSNPMPDWAFCGSGEKNQGCGLLLMNVPGVRDMVADRIGEERLTEAPTCKCAADQQIAVRRLYIASNVPHQMPEDKPRNFDNFVSREGADDAFTAAQEFTQYPEPVVLTIGGDVGRGKSHLAEAITREYLGRGVGARYEFVPRLLDSMRGVSGDEVSLVMARCTEVKVLVLDDLGLETTSDWTNERLTSIVEQRMTRHAKTVVTTNLTHDELARKGYERLASRLFAKGTREARVAVLECSDARIVGVS